jgi:hypothetical protein
MTTATQQWVTTQELQESLRLGSTSLRELRCAGVLKPGTHWIRKGIGSRSPRLWDYAAVIEALRQHTTRSPETYSD